MLQNQANFAHDEVEKQLSAQQIFFPPEMALKPTENDSCLKKYAGQQLVTGKQAQCYADHYIAVHLSEVNDGKNYAQTSNDLRAVPDQNSAEAQTLKAKTQTLFQGELRGLLLTSYGSASSGTAPRPSSTSVTSLRPCCSSPQSQASSTGRRSPQHTRSWLPRSRTSQHSVAPRLADPHSPLALSFRQRLARSARRF